MKQLFYRAIYSSSINKILRDLNCFISKIFPIDFQLPPSGRIKVKVASTKSITLCTNQTNYITHLLFWNGYQNFEYTDIFEILIQKVESYYDIGANIGYYSLLAARLNPKIKIVAFEPARGPFHYLSKNIKINNFHQIKAENIAFSHENGEIEFYEAFNPKYAYLKYHLGGEGNAGSKTDKNSFTTFRRLAIRFDDYVKKNEVEQIDLIKIDTEGTEKFILQEAQRVLSEMKPIVICETLFDTIEVDLEHIFKTHGYEFYNHTERGLAKVEKITRIKDDGVRNCFFVHPSKYGLIEEFIYSNDR